MSALRLVVDTNVLLDCWAFDDATARPLWQAIVAGHAHCLRSAETDAELADVLSRPAFNARLATRGTTAEAVTTRWRQLAQPVARVFAAPWACTDPHDQKFLDLAATAHADLLVTKDKALLKLARKARRDGLQILPVPAALDCLGVAAAPAA